MILSRIVYITFLLFLYTGCGKEEASESKSEGRECKEPKKTHQGCCSSHGGFENNNCTGTQLLYNSSGHLICDDGAISPTCTY